MKGNHAFNVRQVRRLLVKFLMTLFAATLMSPSAVSAEEKIAPEVFVPENRKIYDGAGYAPAVRVGDMLYLSGVSGKPVAPDADEKALRANIISMFEQAKAVLAKAGADFDNVVMMRTYRLDSLFLKAFPVFNEIKKRYVKEPYPAWTDVGVSALVPGAVFELELQAWLGGKRKEAR